MTSFLYRQYFNFFLITLFVELLIFVDEDVWFIVPPIIVRIFLTLLTFMINFAFSIGHSVFINSLVLVLLLSVEVSFCLNIFFSRDLNDPLGNELIEDVFIVLDIFREFCGIDIFL